MEEKVSIIVPVYNAAPYLKRCMESLTAQTYKNTEILLIDDGSTDESGKMCDDFAGACDNVRVFHTANAGVSAARNRGMKESAGGYVTFVDADDYPAPGMVEQLVAMLERTGSDVAGCGYWIFHDGDTAMPVSVKTAGMLEKSGRMAGGGSGRREESGGIAGERNGKREESGGIAGKRNGKGENSGGAAEEAPEILTGEQFVEYGILQSDTRCWSKLYRKDSIGPLTFDTELTIGEDMLFLLELAKEGKRFCRSGYQGYGYYINEKGAMMREFRDSYMDQITCWQRAYELIAEEAPRLKDRTAAIVLISVMLVAGKLAMLPNGQRKEMEGYIEKCGEYVKRYGRNRRILRQLSAGYRIKVTVYRYASHLYLLLYHMLKC